MTRTPLAWPTLLALSLAGAACTDRLQGPKETGNASSPTRGGTLQLASFGDIRSLDPATASDALAGVMVELLYAGLVDFDDDGKVIPDLARSYEISPDGREFSFHLREGVRFHDGALLSASDIKRSIERALHKDTPNSAASYFDRIEGFDAFRAGSVDTLSGVVVTDPMTVKVRLRSKDAMFLHVLALHSLRPVCKSGGSRYDDAWSPCGAGPFRLPPGGWQRGLRVHVVRHEEFYDKDAPRLDGVVFTYGMQVVTQRLKLERGELDVLRDLSQGDMARFKGDARWRPHTRQEPARSIFGEAMNTERPPFDNVEVRRAVAAAINRDEYQALRSGSVVATGKAIPRSVPGFSAEVPGQTFDLERALAHMKRAGYPYDPETGKGGYPKPISYLAYRPGYSEQSAQLLKQQLARIGLRLEIRLVSFATYLTLSQRRNQVDMSAQGWNQDYPEALDFYEALFSSRMIADDQASNSAFYKNPELDGLIDRAREELDPEARQKLYDRAQAIVRDEAPWAMTYENRWLVVQQPYVKDLVLHPVWIYGLRRTWLDLADSAKQERGNP